MMGKSTLPPDKLAMIKASALLPSMSSRKLAKVADINVTTAQRYLREYRAIATKKGAVCPCGKPLGHRYGCTDQATPEHAQSPRPPEKRANNEENPPIPGMT